jgi:hypothetical protein
MSQPTAEPEQTINDFEEIDKNGSKRIRSCKWCANYIYIIHAKLPDGRKRYVPINEANGNFHRCPNRPWRYH